MWIRLAMATVATAAIAVCTAAEPPERWTNERAWGWYQRVAPLRGVNYVPSSAVNLLEWWQADTFDPATIDRELKWAQASGYNSVRCNLSFEVWEADPGGFRKRLAQFLGIAARHKLGVMLCLFDDVNFAGGQPVVGKQPAPVPGVHNSRWVPSPAKEKVTDRTAWPALERYVKDIVGTFRKDARVIVWDLYNEPGNGGLGEQSLPLVQAAFGWARAAKPAQPLTSGPWADHNSQRSKAMVEVSDVVSFHAYVPAEDVEGLIRHYETYGRPILCTETIRRQPGKDFASLLPVFAKHRVSWYNWGLVAGKQQTYLPWEERGKTIQDPWHWDLLWPDGKPYDPQEIELIKVFTFPAAADRETGYVYSTFTGDGEDGLHLLTSADGKTWRTVKNYASLYRQDGGLMRDPSICRGGDGEYHMVWTTGWWEDSLGIAHSKDLINWTPSRRLHPWADYMGLGDEESDGTRWPRDLSQPAARNARVRNCWAPEIFYDNATKEYVIFWATTIDDPKVFAKTWDAQRWERMNQRIYFITTRDFKTYTPRRFFYAKEDRVVIDACVTLVGPKDYRMIIKDEMAQSLHVCFPTRPFTTWAAMPSGFWGPMSAPAFTGPGIQPDNTNAEGPSVVKVGSEWLIYCDYWVAQKNGLFATTDFKSFIRRNDEFKAPAWVRHGTVLPAPKAVIDRLDALN